ncbi:hypothetical protein [Acetobacter senegalensis]|uniref:hypothetical protein n=1 Tax=Acetobacter senegalensis TaxID=446692 RepID=UPI00264D4D57|nr:hypothetical protein [Acetobacter senegalensis]MDN7350443.1 hypothetical protein [Acetobacter senegalensis]
MTRLTKWPDKNGRTSGDGGLVLLYRCYGASTVVWPVSERLMEPLTVESAGFF